MNKMNGDRNKIQFKESDSTSVEITVIFQENLRVNNESKQIKHSYVCTFHFPSSMRK